MKTLYRLTTVILLAIIAGAVVYSQLDLRSESEQKLQSIRKEHCNKGVAEACREYQVNK